MSSPKVYLVREAGGKIDSNWYNLWFSNWGIAGSASEIVRDIELAVLKGHRVLYKQGDVPPEVLARRTPSRVLNEKDVAELLASDSRAGVLLGIA